MRGRVRLSSLVFLAIASIAGTGAACGTFGGADSSAGPATDGGIQAAEDDSGAVVHDAGADAAKDPVMDASPVCDGATACDRMVFVTSTNYSGAFGGVAKADMACAGRASNSMLPSVRSRQFVAWLATGPNDTPKGRFVPGSGRYYRTDGAEIALNYGALTGGFLENEISRDENGATVIGDAWTGANANGTLVVNGLTAADCGGWTIGTNARVGAVGALDSRDGGWSNASSMQTCEAQLHLYCFEQ